MQIPADLHYILIHYAKNSTTRNNYNIYCTYKKRCASAVFVSCFTAQMSTIDSHIKIYSKWSIYNININKYMLRNVFRKKFNIKDMKDICSCFKYTLDLVENKTSYFHFGSQVNAC